MIALQIISIISSLVLLTLSIINIAQIISNHKKRQSEWKSCEFFKRHMKKKSRTTAERGSLLRQ